MLLPGHEGTVRVLLSRHSPFFSCPLLAALLLCIRPTLCAQMRGCVNAAHCNMLSLSHALPIIAAQTSLVLTLYNPQGRSAYYVSAILQATPPPVSFVCQLISKCLLKTAKGHVTMHTIKSMGRRYMPPWTARTAAQHPTPLV